MQRGTEAAKPTRRSRRIQLQTAVADQQPTSRNKEADVTGRQRHSARRDEASADADPEADGETTESDNEPDNDSDPDLAKRSTTRHAGKRIGFRVPISTEHTFDRDAARSTTPE